MYKTRLRLSVTRKLSQCTRYHTVWFDYVFLSHTDTAVANANINATDSVLKPTLVFKMNRKIGNAIIRNKIKRRVKHIVRMIEDKYIKHEGLYIVFYPKKGIYDIDFEVLKKEVENIVSDCVSV